jgi:hypothetical protein
VPDQIDFSVIENSPVEESGGSEELRAANREIGRLSDDLAKTTAEKDSLEQSIDAVIARMLKEYVDKVFTFVAFYCAVVGIFLFMAALPGDGFSLPESILAIIAGSTAVSVIGLIGLVITGLFGRKAS